MKIFNILDTDFSVPDNWILELDGSVISLYDQNDGAGAIQFSIFKVPNLSNINLRTELQEMVDSRHVECIVIDHGEYSAAVIEEELDDTHWRYWMFIKSDRVVLATYNCAKEDIGIEDEIVDGILNSFIFGSTKF